jgi:hypothetical protein
VLGASGLLSRFTTRQFSQADFAVDDKHAAVNLQSHRSSRPLFPLNVVKLADRRDGADRNLAESSIRDGNCNRLPAMISNRLLLGVKRGKQTKCTGGLANVD